MQSKDSSQSDGNAPSKGKVIKSSQIVTAESVQAEEVPTVPLGSLQTLSMLQPEVSVHALSSTRSVYLPAPLVVQQAEYRRSLGEWMQLWWDGMRPAYLPLSLLPVVLGSVLAWTQSISLSTPRGIFHPLRFIATLAAVLLLQLGAHLVNDYYDYIRGIDRGNVFGPGGLIQQGLIKPMRVLSFGLALLGLGTLAGILAAISGSPVVLVFGLLGVLCAYFYSATKRALSSLALGELVSFCIFGPLLTLGSYMVQTGQFDRMVLLYSLPLGLLATAAILANDVRDVESDSQAKKYTLAYVLGLRLSRALYILLVLGAYAAIIALGVPHHAPHLVLITLWTLPMLVVAISGIVRTEMAGGLHLVMRQTIKAETYFTLLLAAALIISALMPILPHLPSLIR